MGVLGRTLAKRQSNGGRSRPATENYEDGISPEDIAAAQQLQIESQAATEDLMELSEDLTKEEGEGAQLQEAVNTYPALVEVIAGDIASNGGVATEAAKYLNFILHQAEIAPYVNVSVESFGDNSKRLGASRVAIEGIKESMRGWWDALVAWLKKMRGKIKTWWTKNFSASAALGARAQNIAKRAGDITNAKLKEKKISVGRLQSSLFVGGKFPGAALPTELKKVSALGEQIFNTWQKEGIDAADKVLDTVYDANLDTDEGINAFNTALGLAVKGIEAVPQGFSEATGDNLPDAYKAENVQGNRKVYRSNELPGSKALYLMQMGATPGGAGVEGVVSTVTWLVQRKFNIENFNKKEKDDAEVSIDVLAISTIQDVAEEVVTFAKIIENYKRNFAEQEKANDNLDKLKKLADKTPDDNNANSVKVHNQLKRLPSPLYSMINEPANKFAEYFYRVGGMALTVCDKSLAQY